MRVEDLRVINQTIVQFFMECSIYVEGLWRISILSIKIEGRKPELGARN